MAERLNLLSKETEQQQWNADLRSDGLSEILFGPNQHGSYITLGVDFARKVEGR
jgi:hypothetical protein